MNGKHDRAEWRVITRGITACERCHLRSTCKAPVVGAGALDADVVIVGEAPGRTEDETGMPFVGRSGKVVERMLAKLGATRDDVYITNVVKCRPPQNATPTLFECQTCMPWLYRQLALIKPFVIIALGQVAASYLTGKHNDRITGMAGEWSKYIHVDVPEGFIWVMPTFHPAYVLRNPAAGKAVLRHFKKVARRVEQGEE